MMNTTPGKRTPLAVSLGLVALICAGCTPPTGTVSGTVTYKNKPVPSGSVMLVTDNNGSFQGAIDKNGAYTVEGVPVGPAKVSVYSSGSGTRMKMGKGGGVGGGVGGAKGMMTAPKDGPPEAAKAYQGAKEEKTGVNIPPKYMDTDTSGLTVDVKSGPNSYDIPLKD
jgi:hypothetical protein